MFHLIGNWDLGKGRARLGEVGFAFKVLTDAGATDQLIFHADSSLFEFMDHWYISWITKICQEAFNIGGF